MQGAHHTGVKQRKQIAGFCLAFGSGERVIDHILHMKTSVVMKVAA